MNDYEITEVRRIRQQLSAQYGQDVKKLADYYRQLERELRKTGKYRFVDQQLVDWDEVRPPMQPA